MDTTDGDAMTGQPVVLINAFEVPEGRDDEFLEAWQRAADALKGQDGYLTAHLHRSLAPNADFRFVNVALWESAEAFTAATSRPEFRAKTPPFPFHPALYEVVREADRA